jgi:membrane protein DedA with SNARE-associated domain
VPTVDQAFQWLTALPPEALYIAAISLAFIENIFPPFPSDVFIGICAFASARGDASPVAIYCLVITGNILGASFTYALGRKYGAAGLKRQMEKRGALQGEAKLERMYLRYGLLGLFIGRFLPGIRGIVPMLAGAMKLNYWKTIGVVTGVAMFFYGLLMGFAFSVGNNWEAFVARISALGRWGTVAGLSLLLVAATVWFVARRRKRRRAEQSA